MKLLLDSCTCCDFLHCMAIRSIACWSANAWYTGSRWSPPIRSSGSIRAVSSGEKREADNDTDYAKFANFV